MKKYKKIIQNKKVLGGILDLSLILLVLNFLLFYFIGDKLVKISELVIGGFMFILLLLISIILTTIPLLALSSSRFNNSFFIIARKIFVAFGLLCVSVVIGVYIFSMFFTGWGEFGYVLMFAGMGSLPVLGILYLAGVVIGLIGLFKN